ncbi:MAG: hypothetical protein RLZZ299_1333 [Pseudomonadota bacterium]|jgi:hypothetical protein
MRDTRLDVDGLREMPATLVAVQVDGILREHVERVMPRCVADLFAIDELGLPGQFGSLLRAFTGRVARELRGLQRERAAAFVHEVAVLSAEDVPATLRAVVAELPGGDAVAGTWASTPPRPVTLPVPAAVDRRAALTAPTRSVTPELARARRTHAPRPEAAPAAPKAPRAPRAAAVEDTRAQWIREDVKRRMKDAPDTGVLESLLVGGVQKRAEADWPDLRAADVLVVLRSMTRGDRPMLRTRGGRWYRAQ